MEKRCVVAPNGPQAQGPYSHAVVAGGLVFVSGQGPVAPDGSGLRKGAFEDEVRLTLNNVKAILEDAGSDLAHVVKVTVFLGDMNKFDALNAIYREYFPSNPPARTCVQAGRLPKDIQVEIEAVAVLKE